MFAFIFVSLMVVTWLALGFLPWLAWSVATRGYAGIGMLPVCMFGAVVAGLAVPMLGRSDGAGMGMSAGAAVAAAAALLAVRRFARAPEPASADR